MPVKRSGYDAVTVGDAFGIDTADLPSGIQNSSYFAIITAANGEAPFTFSITEGELPLGLVLKPSGKIEGTPVKTGTDTFTVEAADNYGRKAAVEFTIIIEENAWFRNGKDSGLTRYNPVLAQNRGKAYFY